MLGFSGFGVMEAFLDIGGSSINLLRMAYKVKDAFDQSVPLEVLQERDSIAALATWLQRGESPAESTSSSGRCGSTPSTLVSNSGHVGRYEL